MDSAPPCRGVFEVIRTALLGLGVNVRAHERLVGRKLGPARGISQDSSWRPRSSLRCTASLRCSGRLAAFCLRARLFVLSRHATLLSREFRHVTVTETHYLTLCCSVFIANLLISQAIAAAGLYSCDFFVVRHEAPPFASHRALLCICPLYAGLGYATRTQQYLSGTVPPIYEVAMELSNAYHAELFDYQSLNLHRGEEHVGLRNGHFERGEEFVS